MPEDKEKGLTAADVVKIFDEAFERRANPPKAGDGRIHPDDRKAIVSDLLDTLDKRAADRAEAKKKKDEEAAKKPAEKVPFWKR